MRNIIITGGELFNKGAQAMTFVAVDELRRRFPEHRIYLLSELDLQRPADERRKYAFDFMGWYPIKFARCQHNPLLRLLCKIRNGAELSEAEAIYRNADMMIDISGYALGSNWSAQNCHHYLDHLAFAKAFGIPVYLMPQSFGPFDFAGEEGERILGRIRELLPSAKMIFAREQEGYDALRNTFGLDNVRLAGDLVLANKTVSLENVFASAPEISVPELARRSVGVIPNARNSDLGDESAILAMYQQMIAKALEQGNTVYLLSHSTHDKALCGRIKALFAQEERVVWLEQEFSCLEFNELVKRFRYLIASRFHSIVHAYKNGVPCIVLGWATKYHELLNKFHQERYMFDVRQAWDIGHILGAMDSMESGCEKETKTILSALEQMQKENVFDILGR
ncbi:MAG: polysaccharide pyruvyl transferase family protein [Clostridia bacterium]|nr:polysaccharide pyruvyl transferase family protein [Clostridia bacterium]